ncbi:MAG: LemA family protein [Planctomycetes bacterium]|nr:LemA family protein [Planctomycetota bacterium]
MTTALIVLAVVVGVFFLFGIVVIGLYNGLVRLRNETKNAWAQIDVQLKRRHDLVPNLVETVKGYAAHERATLENVTKARAQAMGAGTVEERIAAESALSGALGRLMLVVEQYPDLKANRNFLALQEELTSTENKVGFARQFYNDSVMHFNTQLETFPSNFVAAMFSFRPAAHFELADEAAREAPKVKF